MPRIMALARPRSMAVRIVFTASARPENTASPIRKWPMLSSTISGSAAIASAVAKSRPWPAWTSRPAALASWAPWRMRCHSASAAAIRSSASASHQAPVWISITGAPIRDAASICRGSAAMNSETRMPASRSLATAGANELVLPGDVETAFGGALLAPLRHQAGGVRPGLDRDRDHLLGRRHLEIERLGDLRLEPRHVLVADVPAILAQMRGDAVGARFDRDLRRAHGIGMPSAARVANGRDVVDVDAEAKMRGPHLPAAERCRVRSNCSSSEPSIRRRVRARIHGR